MKEPLVIWTPTADGVWTPLRTLIPGYQPIDGVSFSAKEVGGPEFLKFKVPVSVREALDALDPGRPIACTNGMTPRFSGRISDTPIERGGQDMVNVTAEGWYQHLNDDVYERKYVVANKGGFVDTRVLNPGLLPGDFRSNGTVTSDDYGNITIGWNKGTNIAATDYVGVTLDMGPAFSSKAKRVILDWRSSDNIGTTTVNVVVSDDANPLAAGASTAITAFALNTATNTTTTMTSSGTATNSGRYLHIYLNASVAATAISVNYYLTLIDILVVSDTAYESGGTSALTADMVVKDALQNAAPMISRDFTKVSAGSFELVEFETEGQNGLMSPMAAIDAVSKVEDYQFFLTPELRPRAVYRARPTVPTYVMGIPEGATFDGTNTNSAQDMYNKIKVAYRTRDGLPQNYFDEETGTSTVDFTGDWIRIGESAGSLQYDIMTTITTDAAVYQSAPDSTRISSKVAAGGWPGRTAGDYFGMEASTYNFASAAGSDGLTEYLKRGATYVVEFWAKRTSNAEARVIVQANNNVGAEPFTSSSFPLEVADRWYPIRFEFTHTGTYPDPGGGAVDLRAVYFRAYFVAATTGAAAQDMGYLDSFSIKEAVGDSPLDFWGYHRTRTIEPRSQISAAQAERIAELALEVNRRGAMRGSIKLQDTVRLFGTGERLPVCDIDPGELILVENIQDGNTGAFSRAGMIAATSYDDSTGVMDLTIDQERDALDIELERIGA